jgi:PTH1 family peptidyl-tRNA hydrolase
MLVKPLTFMNQSGKYLRSLLSSNSCDVDKSILVHDELTLQVGQMKISTGKSAGGHNGVKSIFDTLGNSLCRLRLGIGQKENPDMGLSDYVLTTFKQSEGQLLESRSKHFLNALKSILDDGIEQAMNIYNQPIKQ